jgi:hypothetical protein
MEDLRLQNQLNRTSPDSSINNNQEDVTPKINTESLEHNSVQATDSIGEARVRELIPSQNHEAETIEEIEKRIPNDQRHKHLMIAEIKKKSMPQRIKLQKILEIANQPDLLEPDVSMKLQELFAKLNPSTADMSRKRSRNSFSSSSSLDGQSLRPQSHISPNRPRTQGSPELNHVPIQIRRDKNSNRELVAIPDSPIQSDSSIASNFQTSDSDESLQAKRRRSSRARSSRSSENEGSAHTNMGAPSRPHIPYDRPTVNAGKDQKSVRPPKLTLGA